MEILYGLGILPLLIVVLGETVAAARWKAIYFRMGIPIYRREYRAHFELSVDTDELDAQYAVSIGPAIEFHELALGEYAFREKLFDRRMFKFNYSPMMRGHIQMTGSTATIIGRLNWTILVMAIYIGSFFGARFRAAGVMGPVEWIVLGAFGLIVVGTYAVQRYRYDGIGTFITQDRRTL